MCCVLWVLQEENVEMKAAGPATTSDVTVTIQPEEQEQAVPPPPPPPAAEAAEAAAAEATTVVATGS